MQEKVTTLEIPLLRKQRNSQAKTLKRSNNASVIEQDDFIKWEHLLIYNFNKEFDPGSGRTLAARLTHASRTENIWFTKYS